MNTTLDEAPLSREAMEAFWLPFTANRQFKANPRIFTGARGMYYTTADGRQVMDAMAGLWCVNAGHAAPRIAEAIKRQADALDYVSSFGMSHPLAFTLATRITGMAPEGLDHIFFVNSGSEAVDTALKIARAYHQARGDGRRTRLIGRAKGYHGMGFGGLSVAGIARHRRDFGPLLGDVDHLPHTHHPAHNAFSRGRPAWGAHLADELEALCQIHDASTIAAVIVEPVAGSTGVLIPPPGYLQRLREITKKHGILLIFDEVITGYGRLGTPFGADYFGVTPDIMVTAKGLTNGVIPMGAVLVSAEIHDAFMTGPDHLIEFFHGYTYSGNPIASAAGLATLETYKEEGLFERGAALAPVWEEALHSLKGEPNVIDVRNIGLVGAIELDPIAGQPTKRAFSAFLHAYEHGYLIRTTGDIIALSPPLIISEDQIAELIDGVRAALRAI